jgi:ATP-binding cassette subfamily C protein CydC
MKQFRLLLSLLKPFLGEILLSILLGIATVSAGIGLLGTSAWLIASAALHPSIAELQVAIVGVRFFGISRGVFRYLERLISHSVNLNLLSNLRENFYRRIEPGAPANLHPYRSGDLLDRVMGDLEILQNFYVRVVAPFVVAVVITLAVSLFTGGYLVECGIILAAGLIINGFLLPAVTMLISRPIIQQITEARAEISSSVVETLQGLEDLQSYNVQNRWMNEVEKKIEQAGQRQNQLTTINALGSGVNLLILNFTILAILWGAIPRVNSGDLAGVSLAVLLLAASASFEATVSMPSVAANLNASLDSARRLFSINGSTPQAATDAMLSIPSGYEVVLEDVSFSYQEDHHSILKNINLKLKKGEKKALIGASGAGKTSLLNILLRFYDSFTGCVEVGGTDLRKIDPANIHKVFGIIPQFPYIFNASLRENLLLAKANATDEDLLKALSLAELNDWFATLANGLDTWLGEHGTKMSAGERQRLATARIILQDPPVVLLDEPTANLDPINESRLLDTLFRIFEGKGMLLTTHKLRILDSMDEIIVLDNSTIIERGGYNELMSKDGIFKRLIELDHDLLLPDGEHSEKSV